MTWATIDNDPPRGMLVNLVTNDRYNFLFNPDSLSGAIEVDYHRISPPGHSGQKLQYKNTGNERIPLELYLSQLAQDERAGQAGSRPFVPTQQMAWLKSLCYPAGDNDSQLGGPPRVLFIWPRTKRLVGRITALNYDETEFAQRTAAAERISVILSFEEELRVRMLMDDVLRIGDLHFRDAIPGDVETSATGGA